MSTTVDMRQLRGSGLIASVKAKWLAYLVRRIERAAIIHLQAMSDRELHDIGLTRSEIAWAVRECPRHGPSMPAPQPTVQRHSQDCR